MRKIRMEYVTRGVVDIPLARLYEAFPETRNLAVEDALYDWLGTEARGDRLARFLDDALADLVGREGVPEVWDFEIIGPDEE